MTDELDMRRRRAAYRANHRGTKEMDVLVGRYADAHLATLGEAELSCFERFLALPDPMLQAWIFSGDGVEANEFAGLVDAIRVFHGLSERRA